ncbi:hypothetical protein HanXRQr2_Chr13g0615351 [Helianthus annuus]|uniref:Uncharacterized protein n=1 Tax=Helianthus annuus TaxID=4232 RepID=A0A9K3ELV2_HELAN|nr:hypothetical protein HanXRQr2_Chr13g0615351 [Helianthus annuus]
MEVTSGCHAADAGSDEYTTTGITSDEIETASEKNIIIHTTERDEGVIPVITLTS